MVPCVNFPVAPAAAIFVSVVIVLSCYTNQLAPYLSHANFISPFNLSSLVPAAPAPKCDIFHGEWVPDPDLPQYTNATCTYIYGNQDCLLHSRPDLGYLKWSWKPHGCDLQRFDPHKFLQVVTNKTFAFVGDSLTRNHYQSLLCLLSKVARPKDTVGNPYDLNKVIYYEGYNFTIHIIWTPFLVRAEEDSDTKRYKLYLDEADDKWLSKVHLFDYVLISAANWFATPAYFYERGQLVGSIFIPPLNCSSNITNYYHHRMAFRTSLRALNDADYRGKVIMRTLSTFSHWEGGTWNKGGDCKRTRPYGRNETLSINDTEHEFYKGQLEEFREAEKVAAARGAEMVLMDLTPAMRMRPDGHPSRYGHWPHENRGNDCVHWCLPGPIDAWNDMLLYILSN